MDPLATDEEMEIDSQNHPELQLVISGLDDSNDEANTSKRIKLEDSEHTEDVENAGAEDPLSLDDLIRDEQFSATTTPSGVEFLDAEDVIIKGESTAEAEVVQLSGSIHSEADLKDILLPAMNPHTYKPRMWKKPKVVKHKCTICGFRTSVKKELQGHKKLARCKQALIKPSLVTKIEKINKVPVSMECSDSSVHNNFDQDEDETIIHEIRNRLKNQDSFCKPQARDYMKGMNKADNLLKIHFLQMPLHEQLAIKSMGPHQPRNLSILQGQKHLFDEAEWLTVSEAQKRFFCFYCLLFDGEPTWPNTELSLDILKSHESTTRHLNNAVRLKTLGVTNVSAEPRADRASLVQRHNEVVKKNRRILTKIVDAIKFCITHELPLPDEDEDTKSMFNRKAFLGLLSLIEQCDSTVKEHMLNLAVSSFTSEPVQNELIDCMYEIYKDELRKDIEKANFVSMHVEQIVSTTFNPQFAIILRYVKDSAATERLLAYIEVSERTATALASAIKTELQPYKLQRKLIAQSYDFPVTLRGPYAGIQNYIRAGFPHALLVHSYVHSLEEIIKDACWNFSAIRLFFAGVTDLMDFFSFSTRETDLLRSECFKYIPADIDVKWDSTFHTVKSVHHNRETLLACFEKIGDDPDLSGAALSKAMSFEDLLNDDKFLFFLPLFYKILEHVEELNKAFQNRVAYGDVMVPLNGFEASVFDLMNDNLEDENPQRMQLKNIANEACSIILSETRERLHNSDHLVAFSVVDPKQFKGMSLPSKNHIQILTQKYPMLRREKLTNELEVLHNNKAFNTVNSVCGLLSVLTDNKLSDTFSEVSKLIEIVLTTPSAPLINTDEDCNTSTVKKIKDFRMSDWYPERLSIFVTFMIHKDVINKIPDFENSVIDYFAKQKPGREKLLYIN